MEKSNSRRWFLKAVASLGTTVALVSGGMISVNSLSQAAQVSASNTRQVKYGMVIDNSKCVACGMCKIACNQQWDLPEDETFITLYKDYVRGDSHSNIVENMTTQCNHCENAPCARICPTKATRLNEDGIMVMYAENCIGCKGCMTTCPYGARIWSEKYKTPEKCRFCNGFVQGGDKPACVKACPVSARTFGNLNDADSEVSKLIEERRPAVLRSELGTKPKIYYIRQK